MVDLSLNFAGIRAPNPFWLASGPPSNSGYQVMKAFDRGWGGAVWKTLGIPTINLSSRYGGIHYRKNRLIGLTNLELITDRPLSDSLGEIELVKKHFPDRALIASLMVQSREQWHRIVRDVENAGVDGIELNFGCPHGMCERGMGSAVGQEPEVVELLTSWVMEVAKVPVLVKLTPNISDITEPAKAAKRAGAHAITLINTIQSIPGVDIDRFIPYPVVGGKSTNGGYSGPAVRPIALSLVKNCAMDPGLALPLSGVGGIETWRDAVEFMLLGAGSVQVCTAVMHHGFGIIEKMVSGLKAYMEEKGFGKPDDFIGKALPNVTRWEELDLNHRMVARIDPDRCTGCQLCYHACEDGAYQAIALPPDPAARKPVIIEEQCVGCNLCALVCPVEGGISMISKESHSGSETWKQRTEAGNIPLDFDDMPAGGSGHLYRDPLEGLRSGRNQ